MTITTDYEYIHKSHLYYKCRIQNRVGGVEVSRFLICKMYMRINTVKENVRKAVSICKRRWACNPSRMEFLLLQNAGMCQMLCAGVPLTTCSAWISERTSTELGNYSSFEDIIST